MATIAELVAKVSFDANANPLKQVGKVMSNLEKNFKREAASISKRLKGMETGMLAAQTAVQNFGQQVVASMRLATDATLGFAKSTAEAGDRIAKTARNIGAGVEELQHLEFAAQAGGLEIDGMRAAIQFLEEQMIQARTGAVTPFTTALERAGLTFQDLEGKTRTDQLKTVAAVLASAGSEAERTASAIQLLGPELGTKMVSVLDGGAQAFQRVIDQSKALGVGFTAAGAAASEGFGGALQNSTVAFERTMQRIGTELMPVVQEGIEAFGAFIQEHGPAIQATLSKIFDVLGGVIGFFLENTAALKALGVVVAAITAAFVALTAAITVLGVVMAAVLSPALPFILGIAAAVAAVAAAWALWGPSFDEIKTFVIGGLNEMIDKVQQLANWLGIAADLSDFKIPDVPGAPPGSAASDNKADARAARKESNADLDAILDAQLAAHRDKQSKIPPDPWTQRRAAEQKDRDKALQEHIRELARRAGDAEFARSKDAARAARVARETLTQLEAQVAQGEIDLPKQRRGGGRGTPDPFTQKHRSTIEGRLSELALIAGEAEFARSRDTKAAARTARETLRELRRRARRGDEPDRRDFQQAQEERNRAFIEDQARAAGQRALFQGTEAADAAANALRRRLEAQGAQAPSRPQGIFDSLGIGGLSPGVASPESRVAATARTAVFNIRVEQDIDTSINLDGGTDVEGLFNRLDRAMAGVMGDATRAALLDVRDQVEA